MFVVKAEVRSDAGPANYSLFQAERVRVAKSTIAGTDPRPYPELEVWLYDQQNNCHETLYVGNGLDHYCAVYIMNERGKTVDSVYPGPKAEYAGTLQQTARAA